MKFKDKDGNMFVNIDFAWKLFCIQNQCEDCPIYEDRNGCALPCEDYVRAHPAEAARLMGYEVIEDEPDTDGEKKGLYRKYIVKKADTGEEVTDCFILRPTKDHAAVAALREYARVTDNKALADDIFQWVGE